MAEYDISCFPLLSFLFPFLSFDCFLPLSSSLPSVRPGICDFFHFFSALPFWHVTVTLSCTPQMAAHVKTGADMRTEAVSGITCAVFQALWMQLSMLSAFQITDARFGSLRLCPVLLRRRPSCCWRALFWQAPPLTQLRR